MPLSEEDFTALIDRGCPACKAPKLRVEALVAQKLVLVDGEPHGSPTWGYKGEDLVRGAYQIVCEACQHELYTASECPSCGSEGGGVERALENENGYPLMRACKACESERIVALAYVPATIVYDGQRASKGRTQTVPEDPGFHAYRQQCMDCHELEMRRDPCPLCTPVEPRREG